MIIFLPASDLGRNDGYCFEELRVAVQALTAMLGDCLHDPGRGAQAFTDAWRTSPFSDSRRGLGQKLAAILAVHLSRHSVPAPQEREIPNSPDRPLYRKHALLLELKSKLIILRESVR